MVVAQVFNLCASQNRNMHRLKVHSIPCGAYATYNIHPNPYAPNCNILIGAIAEGTV